jgi:nickel transport system substrate-binding protein
MQTAKREMTYFGEENMQRQVKICLSSLSWTVMLMLALGLGAANAKAVSQELTLALVGDIGTMNPHLYDSNMGAQTLVYEPLVTLDRNGAIIPWLATSWRFEDNGHRLVFNLREKVKFSDGREFNAQVVKQNFDAVLSNAKRHNWLPLISNLASVKVTAAYTVAFQLKKPYPFTLLELTMVRPVRFLSPGGFGPDGITYGKPLGTGPFVLSKYVKDEIAVFTRNENYWGKKPRIEKLVIRPVPDSNVRLNALLAGEVDMIVGSGVTTVSYLDLKTLSHHPDLATKVEMGDVAQFLLLNPDTGPLRDPAVRQAIALTIDAQEVSRVAYEEMENVSKTMFSTKVPEILGHANGVRRNPDRARELLAEAGWKDADGDGYLDKEGRTLEFMYNIRSDVLMQKTVAELIQAQLARTGIKMNISPVESTVYYKRRSSGAFGMMPDISWGIQYDPQSIYKSFRDGRPYLSSIFQVEAGALFNQAIQTMDANKRRAQFDRIADIFMNEAFVVIPMTITPKVAVYNKRVKGFEFSANVWELGLCLTPVEITE